MQFIFPIDMHLLRDGRQRYLFKQIQWIIAGWLFIGILDALNTYAIVVSEVGTDIGSPKNNWTWFLIVKISTALFAGVIAGTILLFILREQMRRKPFGFALIRNGLIISVLNLGIIILSHYFLLDIDWNNSAFFSRSLILWTLVTILTIIFLHVNDKYGPGVLLKLLLGRYHYPREEERIFMFVDIKSSTSIAEKLGHIKFFNLINDFFRDITDSILYTEGEIYQYVGDQIVISWSMSNGLRKNNCLKCFYNMQDIIQQKVPYYREKYGLVPQFKAGLHCGMITVGEIGIIKKDIVFSGDVVNTTARIESVCNDYGVRLLISKRLLDKLQLPPGDYQTVRMGIIELRGKKEKVELYTSMDNILEQERDSRPVSNK